MSVTLLHKIETLARLKSHLLKHYFAIPTRRAELVEKRLLETEKLLSGVLYERGVDNQGFGTIRSKGDKTLFRLNTAILKRKYGVPESRPLADFLPTPRWCVIRIDIGYLSSTRL